MNQLGKKAGVNQATISRVFIGGTTLSIGIALFFVEDLRREAPSTKLNRPKSCNTRLLRRLRAGP
jgi:hypothetical protein